MKVYHSFCKILKKPWCNNGITLLPNAMVASQGTSGDLATVIQTTILHYSSASHDELFLVILEKGSTCPELNLCKGVLSLKFRNCSLKILARAPLERFNPRHLFPLSKITRKHLWRSICFVVFGLYFWVSYTRQNLRTSTPSKMLWYRAQGSLIPLKAHLGKEDHSWSLRLTKDWSYWRVHV